MEKETLSDDLDDFKLCLDAEAEQRKASQDDLEFSLLEKQWDERDVDQRREEGRPCLTINKLKAFGKQVTNEGRMNPSVINVKPVGGGANKETADIHSDLIRNIETMSQADVVYETAFHFAVYGGLGYFRVDVDYACDDEWSQDIRLSRINNPFSVYGDYGGKEATSIDWNRAYVTDWYSKSAFEQRWGKGRKTSSFEEGATEDANWFGTDKRIRVAERWLRDEVPAQLLKLSNGEVMLEKTYLAIKDALDVQMVTVDGTRETRTYRVRQRLITGSEILEENDWLGKYIPIVPMYGEEINVNGKRHFVSLIRGAKDAQRMFNYHRSAVAERLSLATKAPWMVAAGQVDDHPEWGTANRTNHPYLTYTHVDGVAPPQRIAFAGTPVGEMQAALGDSDDMKAIIGMYDASLGARSNETSGVAINSRKREGDTATYDFIDNRDRAVEHGGRIIVDLIPKVYSVERIMRCAQEDGSTYTIPVNQPVVPRQQLEQMMGQQPQMDAQDEPTGPPEYVPVPPGIQQQLPPEMLQRLQAVTKIFDLTTGKYDVTVTAGPGFTTRRQEASQEMLEFIRVFPQAAPFIGDLLAKNLDWPGSDQVAERLKAMLPIQAQGKVPPIVQQLQQQLQQQDGMAKQAVGQLQQELQQLQAKLDDKTEKARVEEYNAATARIVALGTAAKDGITVTSDASGNMQAVPLVKPEQQPTPDAVIEGGLKNRELALRERELSMKEKETDSRVNAGDVAANAQKFAQIDVPTHLMNMQQQQHEATVAALHHVAQSIAQKPVRKQARAVKQGDGSYVMESVETPQETPPPDQTLQ